MIGELTGVKVISGANGWHNRGNVWPVLGVINLRARG